MASCGPWCRSAGRSRPDRARPVHRPRRRSCGRSRIGPSRARRWRASRSRGATPATTSAATTSSGRAIWSSRRARSWRSERSATARRTLAYLVASQEPDGHWPQNQWVDGDPYWNGRPARRGRLPAPARGRAATGGATHMHGAARPMRRRSRTCLTETALDTMIARRPASSPGPDPPPAQDRWEENAGLTPVHAGAGRGGARRRRGPPARSRRRVLPGAGRRLERLDRGLDVRPRHPARARARRRRPLRAHRLAGRARRRAALDAGAGAQSAAGCLAGRRPTRWSGPTSWRSSGSASACPTTRGSSRASTVADALLRTETPSGPVWHRYNGDGYGEHEDGSPFDGTGIGRGWPLLVGERGHYELDAGRDARPYLEAMRRMASAGGMLPEQVWDAAPIPARGLAPGRPSGSAMPLAWAHAEYVKLVRSIALGHAIDRPEAAWRRYHGVARRSRRGRPGGSRAPRPAMPAGRRSAPRDARPGPGPLLGGRLANDDRRRRPGHGPRRLGRRRPRLGALAPGRAVDATFYWPDADRWEGRNVRVSVEPG